VVQVEDGELVRRERLSSSGVHPVSSPVAGDGKIYLPSADGEVFVLRAGADWEILATNDLGERLTASPTLAPGRVFIRTPGHLYAFGSDVE